MTLAGRPASARAFTTSRYSGSPADPGSLVRSSTAIFVAVSGSAAAKCSTLNGRYSRTFSTPTFSPCCGQVVHGLVNRLGPRAHEHDHPLGVGRAHVVEQVVAAAGQPGEPVHVLLDDAGAVEVVLVDRLASLEVHVGVLAGAADGRPVGSHGPLSHRQHELLVDHGPQRVVAQELELLHLVRSAETVAEVDERHPRPQRGRRADQGQVVRLLHRARGEQGEPGLPHRHDVLVVAEDAERLRGERTGGHVPAGGRELTRDLVHRGDHEQQALAGGERGAERPGLERAVHGRRRPSLRLHLDHHRHRSPQVLLAGSAPGVGSARLWGWTGLWGRSR